MLTCHCLDYETQQQHTHLIFESLIAQIDRIWRLCISLGLIFLPTEYTHFWHNSDKLEMVQRRAARFVKGRYGMYEIVTQMLEELHGFHYQNDVKTLVSFFSTKLSTIWPWCTIHA